MRGMRSLSPLLFSFLAFAFAAPVAEALPPLRGLTSTTFSSTTSDGLWLVEFFSPSCPHCRRFEPTWRELTEKYDPSENITDFHMAQVNCLAQGDLCAAQKIQHYPDMKLYRNGTELETFNQERSKEILVEYINSKIAEHTQYTSTAKAAENVQGGVAPPPEAVPVDSPPPPPSPPAIQKVVNPLGTVSSLSVKNFAIVRDEGPVFVKFFAPWCGHCKKLAPVWTELASQLKGVVNVAEVNCDNDATLCRKEGVEGYPMIFLYHGGNKREYRGPRKLESMEAFAKKGTALGMNALDKPEFIKLAKKENVVFVYLETAGATNDHSEKVEAAAKALLGDPPLVRSSDAQLRTHLGQDDQQVPRLVAVKHSEVVSTLPITISTSSSTISRWLMENKMPTSTELNGENFQSIMRAEDGPYVVLAALNTDEAFQQRLDVEKRKLHEMARDWHKSGKKVNGRSVVFVWMNGKTWAKWLKSMYGIKEYNLPALVITDHQQLVYHDTDATGQPIPLTAAAVHGALDAINAGTLTVKSSENVVERTMRSAQNKMRTFEDFLWAHPLRAVGLIAVVLSLIVIGIWKLVQLDTPPPKNRRLD
ncbi:hypothetical protein FRB94_011656 [Tulasnella sp. JGI-2019a]|nr:hypothetical protein FRB93_001048 [Tulasnella sp. JGI-2019a]KAG9009651.1 hypothetical protein FRB94_011656 [Tulasnella sp. JGI-2019a]